MQHKRHHRIFTSFAATATLAVAAALIAVIAPAAPAAPRVINVDGIITAFTPKSINVAAGEQVSICLKSLDTLHDLTIPTVGNYQVVAPTGPAVCKTLTAPAKVGAYKFICSIPGHEGAGMVGFLVVSAGGGPAPAATSAGPAPQAGQAPAAGVKTPGGPTDAGLTYVSPLAIGGGLLIAGMMSALLGWYVTRRD